MNPHGFGDQSLKRIIIFRFFHSPISDGPNVGDHRTSEAQRALLGTVEQLVCAQHGRVVNGVQVPCRRTAREYVK